MRNIPWTRKSRLHKVLGLLPWHRKSKLRRAKDFLTGLFG